MSDFILQQDEELELQTEEVSQDEELELQTEEVSQVEEILFVPSPQPVYLASVESSVDTIALDTNLNDLGLLGEALLIILLFVAIIALKRGD